MAEKNRQFPCKMGFLDAVLDNLKPVRPRPDQTLREVFEEQNKIMNNMKKLIEIELSDDEQQSQQNSIRIFGICGAQEGVDLKQVVCSFFKRMLQMDIFPCEIAHCYIHKRGTRKEIDRGVVVKFTHRFHVDTIFIRYNSLDANDKLGFNIYPELSPQRRLLRQRAIEKYGKDRVTVVDCRIQVTFPTGEGMTFSTVQQFQDFVEEKEKKEASQNACQNTEVKYCQNILS